ncbi:HAD-IA family hydrolase, partial [Vibrio parahaemolyticus]|nr:HAD-IA family hydrolase [Vibrio parahaemolyticus]
MNYSKPVKCVIFDCDGTLVDSERWCIQAQVDTLASVGIRVEYEWIKKNYQGVKIHQIFDSQIANKSLLSEGGLERLISNYRVRCNQLFDQYLTPIDGVEYVLDSLVTRQIKVCIASNGPLEKMNTTLSLTGLDHYFDSKIFSAFEVNKWKPDPLLIHYVMDKMQVSADECLFVDDSLSGIAAGIGAGVKSLYFAHADPDCELAQQNQLLHKIRHL